MLSKEEYIKIRPIIDSNEAETYLKENNLSGFWANCVVGASGEVKTILYKFLTEEIKLTFFDKSWAIICPDCFTGMTGTIEIPSSVKKLSPGAFRGSNFEKISFASGSIITTIPEQCFANTPELTVVELPDSVEFLDTDAFANTNNGIKIYASKAAVMRGDFSWAVENEEAPTEKDNQTELFYKKHLKLK